MIAWKKQIVGVVIVIVSLRAGIFGQSPHCSSADAQIAAYEAGGLRTWDKLYHWYHTYSGCDDASIGESYCDSVIQILAYHWNTFPRALPLFSSDTGFFRFVLKHIDETAEPDDLKAIRVHTLHSCPPEGSEYCTEIRKAAGKALSSIRIVAPPKSQVGSPR